MASLKEIVAELADSLNRPFDSLLIERLKLLVRHERATLVRQTINKDGHDKHFRQRYIVSSLEQTDISDISGVDSECLGLKTTNKIPVPLRYKTDVPFLYVGATDFSTAFRYAHPTENKYKRYLPMISNGLTYYWIDDYIYVFGNLKLKKLAIEAVYENPEVVLESNGEALGNGAIYCTDDHEFPVTEDLINIIKAKLLSGELSVTDSKDKVEATHLDNN